MTRKDYEMIAEAVNDTRTDQSPYTHDGAGGLKALQQVATYIADGLSQDNPRFNRARFMAACGFPA